MKLLNTLFKYLYLTMALALLLSLPVIIIKGELRAYLLKDNYIVTKGVIIDEKNYYGNDYVEFDFTYSYEFVVNGKIYTEDSHDDKLKVGDSVLVKYVPSYPSFSRTLHYGKDK